MVMLGSPLTVEDTRDPLDVSDPALYETQTHEPLFELLRSEDPVHFCRCPEPRRADAGVKQKDYLFDQPRPIKF